MKLANEWLPIFFEILPHTHTHTHTHIYIYIFEIFWKFPRILFVICWFKTTYLDYPIRLDFRETFIYLLSLFKRLLFRLKVLSLIIFILLILSRLILVLCFTIFFFCRYTLLKLGCVLYIIKCGIYIYIYICVCKTFNDESILGHENSFSTKSSLLIHIIQFFSIYHSC